jgi:hypothetical protein
MITKQKAIVKLNVALQFYHNYLEFPCLLALLIWIWFIIPDKLFIIKIFLIIVIGGLIIATLDIWLVLILLLVAVPLLWLIDKIYGTPKNQLGIEDDLK